MTLKMGDAALLASVHTAPSSWTTVMAGDDALLFDRLAGCGRVRVTSFTFRVPEQHRDFLAGLARFSDDQFDSLCTAFEGRDGAFLSPDELGAVAKAGIEEWSPEDGQSLVSVLFGMLSAMFSVSLTAEEFAGNVSLSKDIPIPTEARYQLRDRLVRLLTAPVVEASGKASNIATENERNFHTARIITEVRPIFRNDPTQPPLGGVVLHQLHVDASVGEDHETYVVTLDERDLDLLKRVVDRALAKGESLETWLQAVGFSSYHFEARTGIH